MFQTCFFDLLLQLFNNVCVFDVLMTHASYFIFDKTTLLHTTRNDEGNFVLFQCLKLFSSWGSRVEKIGKCGHKTSLRVTNENRLVKVGRCENKYLTRRGERQMLQRGIWGLGIAQVVFVRYWIRSKGFSLKSWRREIVLRKVSKENMEVGSLGYLVTNLVTNFVKNLVIHKIWWTIWWLIRWQN